MVKKLYFTPEEKHEAKKRHQRKANRIWRLKNKDYFASYARERRRTPDGYRKNLAARFRREYGITIDVFDALMLRQDGCCAICGVELIFAISEANYRSNRPHLDHDHETGEARGVLCRACNSLLGQAKDSVTTLLSAIDYLKRSSSMRKAALKEENAKLRQELADRRAAPPEHAPPERAPQPTTARQAPTRLVGRPAIQS